MAGAATWVGAGLTPWVGEARLAVLGLAGIGLTHALRQFQHREREDLLEVLQRAAAPLIGNAGETTMRARGWQGRRPATPVWLTIEYDPRAVTLAKDAAQWSTRVCEAIGARLDRPVTVESHEPRRCVLVLRVRPPAPVPEDAPVPELARRAEGIVGHLLGEDASWEATWDEDRLVALDVSHKRGVRFSPNPHARSAVEKTINTMLPGRWRARWDLENDTVRLELRPHLPASLTRVVEPVAQDMARRLPYALDEDGRIMWWDLSSSAGTPHFLMTGSTGTGKTVTIRGIVLEACRRAWQVRVCDPKRVEFVGLKGWPNVEIVATAVPAIVATIHQTWLEMERRYKLIEAGKATTKSFQPLLLVLDEYRYFYGIVNAWYAGVKGTGGSKICPILEEVFLIASLGRTADVHILLGTQRPDADWLGGDVRDQFQARMSMGRLSMQGSQMMWGDPQAATSTPRGLPGRGVTVAPGSGEIVEAQSYWTPDPMDASPEDLDVLAAMRPETVTWPRHVVVPLETVDEEGMPIEEKGRYTAWRDAPYELLEDHPDLEEYTPDALAPDGSGGEFVAHVEKDQDQQELLPEEYGPEIHVRASELYQRLGALLQIDESLDLWAVVETVDEDALDSTSVAVCWRSDETGEDYGVLVLADSDLVAVRDRLQEDEE